jgi:hypothetical protein
LAKSIKLKMPYDKLYFNKAREFNENIHLIYNFIINKNNNGEPRIIKIEFYGKYNYFFPFQVNQFLCFKEISNKVIEYNYNNIKSFGRGRP